jgi:5'-methylthioadenosine phosphorylase
VQHAKVGIIGGTGLGEVLRQQGGKEVVMETPFGPPSGSFLLANWEGVDVAFLARHGAGHTLNPSNVPYRANIWALKAMGVEAVLASGATGSLREEIAPGHLVVCDQVIDKTFRREGTFFDQDVVAHVALADPFCPRLRAKLIEAGDEVSTTVHETGTYVCMEGPQFSTRAESHMHRSWQADLIGMTCMPEAKLAREAELCYALIGLPTDYDCWRPAPAGGHDELVKEVLANLNRATEAATELIRATLRRWGESAGQACGCGRALDLAVWTDPAGLSAATRHRLAPVIRRFLESREPNAQ